MFQLHLSSVIFFAYVIVAFSARLNVSSTRFYNESPPLNKNPARNSNNERSNCGTFKSYDVNNVGSSDSSSGFRLPTALKPVEYFLKIFPIPFGSQEFEANAQIDFKVLNSTCEILLNMADLSLRTDLIKITRYNQRGTEDLALKEHFFYPEKQVGVFLLEKPLHVGDTIRFSVSYTGKLANNSFGLNQIYYKDEDGTEKRVLATYFQPTGARRVYPCIDEPNIKACFIVQIGVMEGERPMSNMRSISTTPGDNNTYWTMFEKTPPMSPYLLAFVISDFVKFPSSNAVANVWGRRSVVSHLGYSSSLANQAVNWLQDFLEVPFPLPKLDLVTFPSYAVPGMENWGLITSSEDSLVTNGKPARDTWVATVTVHEVIHQWVGNLVTPVWWSLYWLSEGFTTFLTAFTLDQLQPELKATQNMLVQDAQFVRKQDHGDGAIILNVKDFNPFEEQAKNIPMYFKGAAVFRMMRFLLGEEVYNKGLKTFFKKFKYRSFSDQDLYTVFEGAFLSSPEMSTSYEPLPTSLHQIMDSWANQKGYPLLTVSRTGDGGISLRQQIFEEENTTSPQPKNQTWWIPVTIATSGTPDFTRTSPIEWLHPTNDPIFLQGVTWDDSWVVLNIQQMAYMRVNYDEGLWRNIANQLQSDHRVIDPLNRIQLLEDSFYLFNSGILDAEVPMSNMQYLSHETEYYPMKTAFLYMISIEILFRREPLLYPLLKTFLLSILSPHLNGNRGKSNTDELRRELVLDWTCKLRDPTCTAMAVGNFQNWKHSFDLDLFPEDARQSMLCSVIEIGSPKDWELVYNQFLITAETKLKKQLINALLCTKNETIINRFLEEIMHTGNNLTYNDAQDIYMSLSYSLHWNHKVWQYVNMNWERLEERFDRAPVPLVTTAFDYEELSKLLSTKYKNSPDFGPEVLQSFLESNKKYVRQNERTISTVNRWLESNSYAFS